MPEVGPGDLAVVIPTRNRWGILRRTLNALKRQTVHGFQTIVVVDGTDETPPPLDAEVIVQEHAGPGAARNRGVAATEKPLVLFLGDDMIPSPDLVARHLAAHTRHPEPTVAVLGHVDWHPEVPRNRIVRWLEWSGTQFDYPNIGDKSDAGWGRFYSCNVSLKREFFLSAGGFDEEFTFDYEDLDLAYRLHDKGLRLLYEREAVANHLHPYDFERLARRYESRAKAERMMMAKHDWFSPYFADLVQQAARHGRVSPVWPVIVDRLPQQPRRLRATARRNASIWYHQRLAPRFLTAWEGEADLEELKDYLGPAFDEHVLWDHVGAVEREEESATDEGTFYRTSEMYLYDLTAFAMTGTKRPYVRDLRRHVQQGARILDYGCGIGSDGLRLIDAGYDVAFADFDNPSTQYLRWRLERRGFDAPIYDVEGDVPGGFDAAFSFDVIEHVDDPVGFLERLEALASVVAVNLLEPDPNDTHLHKPLPIPELLRRAERLGLLHYRRYHGRSHLLIYRSPSAAERVSPLRSRAELALGKALARRP
jgi:GT2 family glycosyltransferase/SAM-dependent methyltransferase